MRHALLILALLPLSSSCSSPTEPVMVREIGTISVSEFGPEITLHQVGRVVTVTISTYGSSSCTEKGETEFVIEGLTANVTPYNYIRSTASSCTRDLSAPTHQVTLEFEQSGSARIIVNGLHREIDDEVHSIAVEFLVTLN